MSGTDSAAARLSTGQTYDAFDRVIARVETSVRTADPQIRGFDAFHVRARIVQRLVEETAHAYSQHANQPSFRSDSGTMSVRGINISLATGDVSVSWRGLIRSAVEFGRSWGRFLAVLLRSVALHAPHTCTPATLLLGVGAVNDESDAEFVEFCRNTRIQPLRDARMLVVEGSKPKLSTGANVVYARRALDHVATAALTIGERLALLFAHLTAPFLYLRTLIASPLSALVGRDLALAPAVRWLDGKGRIAAIVASTSNFTAQPLWMIGAQERRFKLHMVWYSQNFIPKMYVGDEKRSDLPSARHMRVDVHWVWTPGFAEYLRGRGQVNDILIVGPILWYLPRPYDPPARAEIKVAAFDVTPFIPAKEAFAAAKNYYSVETISQFVRDTVDVCEDLGPELGRSVAILLKHKRATLRTHHDERYLAFLEEIARGRANFALIDHRSNVFGLLESCDISVSVPYTSTAYVAASLRKPAVYYDPFAELVPVFEPSEFVYFAAGADALRELMKRLLAGADTTPADARDSAVVA